MSNNINDLVLTTLDEGVLEKMVDGKNRIKHTGQTLFNKEGRLTKLGRFIDQNPSKAATYVGLFGLGAASVGMAKALRRKLSRGHYDPNEHNY